jgi:hypothetical protein
MCRSGRQGCASKFRESPQPNLRQGGGRRRGCGSWCQDSSSEGLCRQRHPRKGAKPRPVGVRMRQRRIKHPHRVKFAAYARPWASHRGGEGRWRASWPWFSSCSVLSAPLSVLNSRLSPKAPPAGGTRFKLALRFSHRPGMAEETLSSRRQNGRGSRRGHPRRLSRRELAAIGRGRRARSICAKGNYFLAQDWLGGRDRGGLGGASQTLSPGARRERARGQHVRAADSLGRALGLQGASQTQAPIPILMWCACCQIGSRRRTGVGTGTLSSQRSAAAR